MNNLLKFAMGMGVAAASVGTYGLLTNAYSDHNRGDWDWQYKGSAFRDRVGNFTLFSDNKSRYNDYLKGYNKTIGYNFDLSKIDANKNTANYIQEEIARDNTGNSLGNVNLNVFGNPTGANTQDSNNYILENKVRGKSLFVTSYNNEKGRPNWVAYKVDKNNMGGAQRQNDFRHDSDQLPSDFRIIKKDAVGNGFDRGHNFPSALATSDAKINSATYVMTNISYQASNINQGPWVGLEKYIESKAKGDWFGTNPKIINVISGNLGSHGTVERINGVEVPKLVWKVAIIQEPGKELKDAKSIITLMPNTNNVSKDVEFETFLQPDGKLIKKLIGIKRLIPGVDKDVEEAILSRMYVEPKDRKNLLNLDTIGNNFRSAAVMRARARGIHNPLMTPIYDADKKYKGFVFNNKKSHSESFELARYNASMRATGRFNSVVDPQDFRTYETLLRGTKIDGQLNDEELRFARSFDLAANTPTMASRINEFFFIPMGMGRVYKEEKGIIPSIFGTIGALIDQSYLVNNPAMQSATKDGEEYFTTRTSLFQDLFENSAAGVLASASSVAVYLAIGAPLKVMASEAIVKSQEKLIEAASKNNSVAKFAAGGNYERTVGFKLAIADRIANGSDMAFYDLDNPTFSLYWLDNYERHRGGSFFTATARNFLMDKVSPYKIGSDGYLKLRSAINDYVNVLQSPADIQLIYRDAETTSGVKRTIKWDTESITTASGQKFLIKDALKEVRKNSAAGAAQNLPLVEEINDAINKKYTVKITNVSLERSMELAKKTQAILNLMPMPWAWGIFTGRTMTDVTSSAIGNLLDIEGFTRHINASINNQGFWGAAHEFMQFNIDGTKTNNAAFRIVNHFATITRSILSFNEQGGQSKADLEHIMKISKTYSNAERNIKVSNPAAIDDVASGYTQINTDDFGANPGDDEALRKLLANEAEYQRSFKEKAGTRSGLTSITLEDETLFKYANSNRAGSSLGFILNTLDNDGNYLGMKIASTKLTGAKYILGTLFIAQLVSAEFLQRGGVSLFQTALGQGRLNRTSNHTAELSSTPFISVKDFTSYLGANADWTNVVGGLELAVMIAGVSRWAWEHASTFSPEIQAKIFTGEAVIDLIDEVSTEIGPDGKPANYRPMKGAGYAGLEAELAVKDKPSKTKISAKINGQEIAFNVERNPATKQIVGLKSLTARVSKNYTSFTIALGVSLAAMQIARFVVTSAINTERQIMGSSVLATYALAVPAGLIAITAMADNLAHTFNLVTGKGHSNYKWTAGLVKGAYIGKYQVGLLPAMQGLANLFGRSNLISTVAAVGITALVTGAYIFKLTPFQGDINGPKADDTGITAIAKLGEYSRQVLQRIEDIENNTNGNNNVSDNISPLEVNAALFSIALGKIINPLTSSQKGSTAFVMAIQSPTPVFQYYSVLKKVVDGTGNSYTTLNLGLQGPPLFGFAPINVSLPIAFAMNAKSADGVTIRTGYFGSGIMLNENSKDSLNLADYYSVYSNLMLASSAVLAVSSTFERNRSYARNQQILKKGGTLISSDSLLTRSLRGSRDRFASVARLPFEIAAQSLRLAVGDLRMPTLRLRSAALIPAVFNAFVGMAFSNHMIDVFAGSSIPYKDNKKKDDGEFNPLRIAGVIGVGIGWLAQDYYRGTFVAARKLSRLEAALDVDVNKRFDHTKVDYIHRKMYGWEGLKQAYRTVRGIKHAALNPIIKAGKGLSFIGPNLPKIGKFGAAFAVGAFWNHFITDPTVGKVNPQLAYGNIREENQEDRYTFSARRHMTVLFSGLIFAGVAVATDMSPRSFMLGDVDVDDLVERYKNRLGEMAEYEELLKTNKNPGLLAKGRNWYNNLRASMEGKDVSIIIEEAMHNSPVIEYLNTTKLAETGILKDPNSQIREKAASAAKLSYDELKKLAVNEGEDLQTTIKNRGAAEVRRAVNEMSPTGGPRSKALNEVFSGIKSASMRINVGKYTRFGIGYAAVSFAAMGTNWMSQALGYKDFQDAFVGADTNNDFKNAVVDSVKLLTGYDREYSYDISRGLAGPNLYNSKGEFLISPGSTRKGGITNALKNLNKLIVISAPNTFVGVEVGGITIRPDDRDQRISGYFQLQSASQDFSSAMYSMSAVFGLQGLASKGFFKEQLIANLRGIDDAEPKNQAQLRSIAANIISAVYSQPARRPKDRIKFTKVNQFTLEAMQTNKALSMSLSRRYKTLQALSFGSTEQLAMFTLMNNMNIAAPEMQNKFYKALREIADNDNGLGLGELNQNFFMGGRLKVIKSLGKFNNLNPFQSAKVTETEMSTEDAFMNMQSIALSATTNQLYSQKSLVEGAGNFISEAFAASPLAGLSALPPLVLLPFFGLALGTLGLGAASTFFNLGGAISSNEVAKDNFKLYDQNAKFFDEGDWFSNNPIEATYINKNAINIDESLYTTTTVNTDGSKTKNPTTNKYIIVKRAGIVFNVGDNIDHLKIKEYTEQIDSLSANLASKFTLLFQQYAQNYGKQGDEYVTNKTKLNDFYDHLEKQTPATPLPNETAEATRAQRIARSKASSFKPIMADYSVDTSDFDYRNQSHKITDHILDTYTQKQALDAYLEGQYISFHEQDSVLTKQQFVDRYYSGLTYDQMLDIKANEFISDKGLNIFGKDRHGYMSHSTRLMSEVYAAKYDVIIDAYFDAIDETLDDVFKGQLTATDNVFTKFAPTGLNGIETIDEGYVRQLSVDNRMNTKAELRARIESRINNIMQTKRTGVAAVVDKMLNIVGASGRVKDNLNRIALEAGQEAIDVVKTVRTYGGNMFTGQGGQVEDDLMKEVAKQAELNILNKTSQGISGNMSVGQMPNSLKTTAGLTVLEGLSRVGNWIMNAFQAAQFVSLNILTLRAGASIASSKTHEREKEMAREEMAQEAYNNMFAALFWGSIMSSDKFKQYGYPIAGGAIAGYVGYELLFKGNLLGASLAGTAASVIGSIMYFNNNKTWGLSLGIAGITMIGRGVLEQGSTALSSFTPEVGAIISKGLDNLNDAGQNGARAIQDNARFINTIGGGILTGLAVLNLASNINVGNILLVGASAFITVLGIADLIDEPKDDGRNNKIEGASRVALGGLSNLIFSNYKELGKATTTFYTKHIAKYMGKTAATQASQAAVQKVAGQAIKKSASMTAIKGGIALIGNSFASFFAHPLFGIASTILTIGQLALMFLAPEATDEATTRISNMPTQVFGQYGSILMKPANQIYNEKRYRDNDPRNPMFQGTVNDAIKEQWLAQIDTLDDPTGRKTAGRNVISFDAPLIGYSVTSEGYGPGAPTPVQDFAFAIRGKAYNQLITGRQYWNSRMNEKFNHEQMIEHMKISDKLQIQAWEQTVKNVVSNQNRKIAGKPAIGAKDYIAVQRESLAPIAEISKKTAKLVADAEQINNKSNLVTQIKGVKTQSNKDIQQASYIRQTVNIKKTVKEDTQQTVIEFSQGSAKDAEQVAVQHFNLIGNNYRIEQNNLKPIV